MIPAGGQPPQCYPLPSNDPDGGGLAIYDHPSRSRMLYGYTYMLASCQLYTTYLYTIYMIPLQHPTNPTGGGHWGKLHPASLYLQRITPIKYFYSRHILATVKISYAIHTCRPCATVLRIHHLHGTSITPTHPNEGCGAL